MDKQAYKQALEWYLDQGLDEVLDDSPVDRFALQEQKLAEMRAGVSQEGVQNFNAAPEPKGQTSPSSQGQSMASMATTATANASAPSMLGASEIRKEAIKLAQGADTLEALKTAIAEFDGIALKKTASNMVFAAGHKKAKVMIIGEAPGGDEDRQGEPFVGQSGALLDKILSCIDLGRGADEPEKAVYITNILNWRPPGNRTPSPGEIEASLPFIEKHIQLIKPDFLILCGTVAAKSLLGKDEGISRLRKKWHDYTPQCTELQSGAKAIPAMVTFHPSYILRTPSQKRAVWGDMLMLQKKRLSEL